MTALDWVLCILCSLIGCIMGIVYLSQGKKKGTKMIIISVVVAIIAGIIQVIAGLLLAPQNLPLTH